MASRDHYAMLGVARTASDQDIKQAFRKLARRHHPDVNPGDAKAEARFKEINEAYEVLSNAETRRKYDAYGDQWRAYEQAGGAPFGAQGQPGGFRMRPEDAAQMFGGTDGFGDVFAQMFGDAAGQREPFGGRRGRSRGRQRPSQSRDVEVVLTLDEAIQGTTRTVSLAHENGGSRSREIRIPPGVTTGTRVRLPGTDPERGELFLRVTLAPHPQFTADGHDLRTTVAVPLTTAVLGGVVVVPTLTGGPMRIKVPAGSPHGRSLRVKGHGLPAGRAGHPPGDLHVVLHLAVPTTISDTERAHWEALDALQEGVRA